MKENQNSFVGQFDATQNIIQTVQTNKKESDIWNEYFSMEVHYILGNGNVHAANMVESLIKRCAHTADLMINEYNKRYGEKIESK